MSTTRYNGHTGRGERPCTAEGHKPRQVAKLDRRLRRWADVVEGETKTDGRGPEGAGAAGGVGFAALAVLRARTQPGIEVIVDRIELDRHLQGGRAVVTGAGSLDRQSLRGKAAVGVGSPPMRGRSS
jgi:glycerate 2-kinase